MIECNERGIPCTVGSCGEIYLEKAFEKHGLRPANRLSIAKELGETSLMFLVHPTINEAYMRHMADAVRGVTMEASLAL
jgi:dTDP-4-amino-4,6-dideoxygalactose transaminase